MSGEIKFDNNTSNNNNKIIKDNKEVEEKK